jgi:hypothetical protein
MAITKQHLAIMCNRHAPEHCLFSSDATVRPVNIGNSGSFFFGMVLTIGIINMAPTNETRTVATSVHRRVEVF